MTKVLEISDTHVGSKWGISHPDYLSFNDRRTTDCEQVYENYCEVRDWAGQIDALILGGDLADGWNPKEHGDDRTATEQEQVEIESKLIRELRGTPIIWSVDGSPYHRGSSKLDERISESLGARRSEHFGVTAPPYWDFKVEDVNFNVSHFIPVSKSTWQYQTTPIAREEVLAVLNENPAHVVLRFHAHYFVYAGFTDHIGMVCPSYQTKTPFQGRISPFGRYRLGSVLFTIDGDKWDWDQKIWKTKLEIDSLEKANLDRANAPPQTKVEETL